MDKTLFQYNRGRFEMKSEQEIKDRIEILFEQLHRHNNIKVKEELIICIKELKWVINDENN